MTKRILTGKIVSSKNKNTVVIQVERKFRHPVFKKVLKRSKKYHAHYEDGDYKIGDQIRIIEKVILTSYQMCRFFMKLQCQ